MPDWDFTSPASAKYPSLQAAGKVHTKHSNNNKAQREQERLLQKLIEGTVRLNGFLKTSDTPASVCTIPNLQFASGYCFTLAFLAHCSRS